MGTNKKTSTGGNLNFADLAWVIGGGALVAAAIICAVILGPPVFGGPDLNSGLSATTFELIFMAITYGVFLATTYITFVQIRGFAWRDIGFKSCAVNFNMMGALVALLWISVSSALYSAFGYWDIIVASNGKLFTPFMTDAYTLILFCIMAGPLAAIVEETIFRGLLYRWLRQQWGVASSALVSAVLFALVHPFLYAGSVELFLLFAVDLIALAVILALLYEISGSLWPCIIAHAGNNLLLLGVQAYLG
jgi:uncharacterized protein